MSLFEFIKTGLCNFHAKQLGRSVADWWPIVSLFSRYRCRQCSWNGGSSDRASVVGGGMVAVAVAAIISCRRRSFPMLSSINCRFGPLSSCRANV